MNKLILIAATLILASLAARADEAAAPAPTLLEQARQALAQKYPQARVEITGEIQRVRGALPASADRVSLLGENGRGEATLLAVTGETSAEIRVSYLAWIFARVANRRIMPSEALTEASFLKREVNLSEGQAFVYRGVILPASEEVARLETRQSILEGQFLTQSAVQRIPDLKRGDWVKIQLNSGDLQLSTTGNAAEPGFTRGLVKVITTKSKRELAGTLRPDGIVEVKL